MTRNFENIVLNMDQEFNKFMDLLKEKIDFAQFAPDEVNMITDEIYQMYFGSILNAIALSLTKEEYIAAENEISVSPYVNPLDIFLSFAADDPRIDEFISQELDILLEKIVSIYNLKLN